MDKQSNPKSYSSPHERQWAEVEVIQSIYTTEYEALKYPWKLVEHPPYFVLHLSITESSNDHNIGNKFETTKETVIAAVDVTFKMSKLYPDELPEISITRKKGCTQAQMETLQAMLLTKAQELKGFEMVFDLAELVKDFLDNNCRKRVSFHETMLKRQIVDHAKVNEEQTKLREAEEAAKREQDIILERKIQEEIKAKEAKLHTIRDQQRKKSDEELSDRVDEVVLVMDPPLQYVDPVNDSTQTLHKLALKEPIASSWPYGSVFKAESRGDKGKRISLVVKRIEVTDKAISSRRIEGIVKQVEEAVEIPTHTNLLQVYGAQLDIKDDISHVWMCSELVEGESMDRLLEIVGTFNHERALAYTHQLLTAIAHLHSNNVVHRAILPQTVLIDSRTRMTRLLEPIFYRGINDVLNVVRLPDAPEIANMKQAAAKLNRKADIWMLGRLLLVMIQGSADANHQHGSLKQFIDQLMSSNPNNRPSAQDALLNNVFTTPISSPNLKKPLITIESVLANQRRPMDISFDSTSDMMSKPTNSPSADSTKKSFSRYAADFEEILTLGKGGFGQVFKVRNRIDNRFYAIKRIALNPKNVASNRKTLREVTTLSRLYHERIVRYYQAWIEEEDEKEDQITTKEETFHNEPVEESSDFIVFADNESSSNSDVADSSDWLSTKIQAARKMYSVETSALGGNANFSLSKLSTSHLSEIKKSSSEHTTTEPSTENNSTFRKQFLYIQMEFCPNQTLREVIDDGVSGEEAWRLFRQILEGLAYIHKQGMIHRDLKPGNIFIDANGDAKLGDFGLAVTNALTTKSLHDANEELQEMGTLGTESYTTGIGTPFYVSPELLVDGARYNQRVDMYSLGVIFVELWCHFNTRVERMHVLREVRNADIILPPIFNESDFVNQMAICKKLLVHDPKQRASATDLLRSELLPARMEDETIKDAIRSLSNPNTPYYSKLVNALFSQTMDRHKDFAYDFHSGNAHDPVMFANAQRVRDTCVKVFQKHGAIEFLMPLFSLKTESSTDNNLSLLDNHGQLLELPFNLTKHFARFIAQNGITDIKRFAFERVFRSTASGGQPRQPHECDFDIVSSGEHGSIDEAEVLKVAVEVMEECSELKAASLTIVINTMQVLEDIMTHSQVPIPKFEKVLQHLSAYPTNPYHFESINTKRRAALNGTDLGIPQINIDTLLKWGELADGSSDVMQKLKSIVTPSSLNHIKELIELLKAFNLEARIVFDPLFCYLPHIYSGLMFQLVNETTKRKLDILAGGGRYDKLVEHFKLPSEKHQYVGAVGVSFSVGKLVASMDKKRAQAGKGERLIDIDVLVYSFGANMLCDRMTVCADLWKVDIKAEFMNHDEVNQELLHQACKARGIHWVVILREHQSRGPFGTIKIKNLEKRTETEVMRRDLIETLLKNISDIGSSEEGLVMQPSVPASQSSAISMLSITINSRLGKISNIQKGIIRDKAVKALNPLFSYLSSGKSIEIIAHDIPRSIVSKFLECLDNKDELGLKKVMDCEERESLMKLRQSISLLREKFELVLLFNYKDNSVEFVK